MKMPTRSDIAEAIVLKGLTYSVEQETVYMRERPLNDVIDAVILAIESKNEEGA